MKLRNIDLNLLVAFVALIEELSVTRAAKRIGLSQPATSNALARLREIFQDPLLVRSSRAMVATPTALELCAPIRSALGEISATVAHRAPFDPLVASRTFRVAMTDYSQFVLLPTLLERLATEAPGIELVIRPIANAAAAVSALEEGPLDLGITATKDEAPGFHRRELFRDRYVCLIREAHPDVGSELTVRRYAALRHVLVAPQGGERSFIDDLLAQRDLKRRIATRVPGFAAVPWIVAGADVAATVPARIAEQHASALRLRVLDVPLPLGTSVWSEFWHDRVHVDRGHVWMRNLIADVAGALR